MATAAARLALYEAAEAKVLLGQVVQIDDMQLTRANLKEIRAAISELKAAVNAEARSTRGPRSLLADFRD